MAGRDQLPGEGDPFNGLRDHARYHSRIVRGQLQSVVPENGTAQVATLEIIGVREITIPPLWFSASGRKSAWGRFMPLGNEHVHVGYRNDDTPVVLGYDMKKSGLGEGYDDLRKLNESRTVGYASFRKLKLGEFDFKSSGDAYIHGSNQGTLYLSGGQAFIRLDKQSYKIDSKASTYSQLAETSNIKFGTVFRKLLPTDVTESPVSMGIFKEFLVDVNLAVAGVASPRSKAKLHFGDIVDLTNALELSIETGVPVRGRISIADSTNALDVFKLDIDHLGNVVWTNNDPRGVIGTKMRSTAFDMEATLDARFNGATIHLGSPLASEPLVLGNTLLQAFTDFINTVFVANAANWGIGNLGAPVPLSPTVLSALQTWLTTYIVTPATNITSIKAFTERGP